MKILPQGEYAGRRRESRRVYDQNAQTRRCLREFRVLRHRPAAARGAALSRHSSVLPPLPTRGHPDPGSPGRASPAQFADLAAELNLAW